MQTIKSKTMQLAVILMLLIALFGTSNVFAASLPASACISTGTGTVTCNLWAMTGTATLFGSTTVNIWGYSTSAAGPAGLPGPALIVNQGDLVTVNLHNVNIPESTSLDFQGQSLIPDTIGTTSGSSKTYAFTASNPGTFRYEAGLTTGVQHQVALGLYGALVVKSSTSGTAYGTAATAFDEETLLVLSEVDPALNSSLTPAIFDMRKYAPRYFLVNGRAYPDTDLVANQIPVAAGHTALLRYVNAGLQGHAMATLGIAQKVIAADGFAFAHPYSMVAETIATGQTLDTLVTISASAVNGTRYPLYDADLMLRNTNLSSTPNIGGMLTFLTVGTAAPPVDTGPFVNSPSLSPASTNGASAVTVNATITDAGTLTVNNITAAEFYIDSTAGSPIGMTGSFGSPTVSVTGTIPTATLASLASGNHSIYVRGQDSLGTWSSFLSVTLNLDKTGPASSGLALSPNPSSGAVPVALSASGNDTASGNSNVTAAEYWVDAGAHLAMTASGVAAPIRNFTATIPAGLAQGTHVVSVRSQDIFGNWGAVATINLQVADTAAPTTSGVSASPNPNNGSLPYNTSTPAVRVFASFSDVASGNSNIAAAEGFLDTIGATGSGFVLIANDGVFNSPAEPGYGDIPMAVVGTLTAGNHTIYVHARDAAGNWGAMATTVLVIDKTPPTVSSINRVGPSSFTNAASVQFLVTFSESVNGGAPTNFTITTSGTFSVAPSIASVSAGPGNTRIITVNTGSNSGSGTHTIRLDMTSAAGVTDLAGNALIGLPFNTGQTFTIDKLAPTFTSVTINPTSMTAGTASISMSVNGSADSGGSGLASAGEYWFDAASITPGTGTSFTGTSGISVATGTLTAGSHTLRVRILDNAGNWSTVHTASLTVTVPLNNPTVSKTFLGAVRGGNGTQAQRTTTLTITLSNSNATALSAATLTDNLPQPAAGTFTVVSSSTTCGGTTSTANSSRRLLLAGGTIPANGSCTVTAIVRLSGAATNGPYTLTNTIAAGGVTTTNAGNNLLLASAVLTVNP